MIINNTDYIFTPDQQGIINSGAANCGVDTVYTQQGSESVFNFFSDESFKDKYYLFSIDVNAENIFDFMQDSIRVNKTATLEKAAKHFLDLYADEIESVTPDTIHEWWGMTEDQYEGVEYEELEEKILSQL